MAAEIKGVLVFAVSHFSEHLSRQLKARHLPLRKCATLPCCYVTSATCYNALPLIYGHHTQ